MPPRPVLLPSQKIFMKSKAINFDPFDLQLLSELLKNIF